jgi:alcohol dehydrogenase (NADP+)
MGAEVTAFTSGPGKVEACKRLGAKHVVVANTPDFHKPLARSFDLIISTRDVAGGFPLSEFITCVLSGATVREC